MQVDFICACKNTRTNAPSCRIRHSKPFKCSRSLAKGVQGIICRYHRIADYTMIILGLLVHKIT